MVRHQLDRFGTAPLDFEAGIESDLAQHVAAVREQVAGLRKQTAEQRQDAARARAEDSRRLHDLATVLGSTSRHVHAVYCLRALGVPCGWSQAVTRDHAGDDSHVTLTVGHEFGCADPEHAILRWDGESYTLDGRSLETADPEAVIPPLASHVHGMCARYAVRRLQP